MAKTMELMTLEIDCGTGERHWRALTSQELQERKARREKAHQGEQRRLEQEVKQQKALARAQEDPAFALLLEALGITTCTQ